MKIISTYHHIGVAIFLALFMPILLYSQALPVYNSGPQISADSLNVLREEQRNLIRQGSYLEAVEVGMSAIKVAKELEDHKAIIALNNNNGIIYYNLGNLEEASESFKECLLDEQKMDYPDLHAKILNNLGLVLMDQDSLIKARAYFEESIELKMALKDTNSTATTLVNIGLIHHLKEERTRALSYFDRALEIFERTEDLYNLSGTRNNIAKIYIELGAYGMARKYLETAEEEAKQLNAKEKLMENYLLWSTLYEKNKNYAKAINYKNLQLELKDSILNEELAAQIAEWQSRYEAQQKDHSIDILSKEKVWQEQQLVRQKQIQRSLVVVAAILIAIIYLLYQNIIARKLAQRETQQEKDLSNAYLNATDGILMKAGDDLKLKFINEKGAQLLGIHGHEEEKSIWDMLTGGKEDVELEGKLKMLISGERIAPISVRSNIEDAEENLMHFTWNITRLSKEGEETILFFSGHDLTEINFSESTIKMAMIEGQEQEKERIAKEIQDSLGPLLSSSKLRLLEYVDGDVKSEAKLLNTIKLLDKSMGELKAISQSLSANRIKNYGLIASVMESCQEISARTQTEINFQPYYIQGVFPNDLELAIYRIFQEITLFSIQYLKSKTINVHLIEHTNSVLLNIFHDGRQMDHTVAATSEWTNVNTRVQIANGTLKTQHSPKQGYLFSISFPHD